MQQYFVKGDAIHPIIIEDKDTLKHMFQVMRLSQGAEVILVFDDGVKRLARLLDEVQHSFELVEELEESVELPISVTIAMGFPKGDKLEFVAQKGTELGMTALWGFPADWSVVKWDAKKLAKKVEKLDKITLGAAEQSKRNRVPEVTLFEKKSDFLEQLSSFDAVLLAYEEAAKAGESAQLVQVLQRLQAGARLLVIVGPEGGISPDEVQDFEERGAVRAGFGPRIMRTETAPLYALSAVSFYMELLGKKS